MAESDPADDADIDALEAERAALRDEKKREARLHRGHHRDRT